MGSLLGDAPLLDHNNIVGMADGRQAVGNDDGCFALCQAAEILLNGAFRFRIDRAGRFIQDQHRGVFQYGAGDAQPLALPPRKFDAPFPHNAFISIRKGLYEIVELGFFCRFDDVLHRAVV